MATDFRAPAGPWDMTGVTYQVTMYDGSCQAGVTSKCEATCAAFSTTFPTTPVAYHIANPSGTSISGLGVRRCVVPGANPAVTCANGVFAVSGCATPTVCTRPADLTGYGTPTETNLITDGRTPFDVNVACDTGWEGNPVVSACTTSGPYMLTGCAAIVCTTPAATTGFAIVETNLDLSAGAFDATVTCASGYESTGATLGATTCGTSSGAYALTGTCSPIVCTTPTAISDLYETPTESDLSMLGFGVTATCAAGTSGTATVTACTADGEEYTLGGCFNECIQRVGIYYHCSGSCARTRRKADCLTFAP